MFHVEHMHIILYLSVCTYMDAKSNCQWELPAVMDLVYGARYEARRAPPPVPCFSRHPTSGKSCTIGHVRAHDGIYIDIRRCFAPGWVAVNLRVVFDPLGNGTSGQETASNLSLDVHP